MRTFFFLLLPQVIDFPCSCLYLIQQLPFSIILDLKQSLVFDTATTSLNHPRPQAVACIRYSDYFHYRSSTSWLGLCVSPPCLKLSQPQHLTNLTNFGLGNGLVKISDTLLSVGMYFTSILPSSTASRIK